MLRARRSRSYSRLQHDPSLNNTKEDTSLHLLQGQEDPM